MENAFSGSNYSPLTNTAFYSKAIFNPPAETIGIIKNIDFYNGQNNGLIVNSLGRLTINSHIVAVFLIDDTASISWSDPIDSFGNQNRKIKLNQFIQEIIESNQNISRDWNANFVDFWLYSNSEIERTNGFENTYNKIQEGINNLSAQGNLSNLNDVASICISGLQMQSIIDFFNINSFPDGIENTSVTRLINYLIDYSLLNLNQIYNYWNSLQLNKSLWNGTSSNIAYYNDVSTYLVKLWAESAVPIMVVVTDGVSSGEINSNEVVISAQSAWEDRGAPIHCILLGEGSVNNYSRTLSDGTGGKNFAVTTGDNSQWDEVRKSFERGGINNLYSGVWTQHNDYLPSKWIRYVEIIYTEPQTQLNDTINSFNSQCIAEIRWTTDRINFTPWTEFSSGVKLFIRDEVSILEYRITMREGWREFLGGNLVLRPQILSFVQEEISPAYKYFISYPQAVDGMLLEYILSASLSFPKSAILTWGICRGDSVDFSDFETIITNRKSALSNRQQSIKIRPKSIRVGLSVIEILNTGGLVVGYQVVSENGNKALWSTTDIVSLTTETFLVDPSAYSVSSENGQIFIKNPQQTGLKTTVDITTPESLFVGAGENTYTNDNKTYYSINGRWLPDSKAIVIVNGKIKRGGFKLFYDEGMIIFNKELYDTDIVNLFILQSNFYRVGVEIKTYSDLSDGDLPVTIDDFGLIFTGIKNSPLLFKYNNTALPIIKNLKILPSIPKLLDRLVVDYNFISPDGNDENSTLISWWRYRPSLDTTSFLEIRTNQNSQNFIRIGGNNNLVDINGNTVSYDNRTTSRSVELNNNTTNLFREGDKIFVIVQPSDGFNIGIEYISEEIIIHDYSVPYITSDAIIVGIDRTTNVNNLIYYPAGNSLTANYSVSAGIDNSIVNWYTQKNNIPFYTGKIVPVGTTNSGEIVYYLVTPVNGDNITGLTAQSELVNIR